MHIAQNFIPMLNNQYKQYRCYYFSRGSPCKVSSRDLVLVISFDADHSRKPQNPLLAINISALSLFARSATLIYTQVWFMAKQLSVSALTAALFFKMHLCVIKVTARKYLSGSLIKTEGEILITEQRQNKSAQPAESKAKHISAQPWPPRNPSDPAPSSQLKNSYCRLLICISPSSGVLCVLFIFVQIKNVTGKKKNNLNENKAKDSVPWEKCVLRWVFF